MFSFKGNSQVSCYAFSESAGSYTALSSPTTVFTSGWDDNVTTTSTPIGFTFNFNGTAYTNCLINSNGYITFGAASVGTNYDPISSGSFSGAISAFGRDLISNNSTIVRATEGSAPNRVFVVQWNNARRYSSSAIAGDDLNFQIRIYETTNKIDIVYGTCTITNTTSRTCQIGLRGSSNADYNNRTLASSSTWLNSTDKGSVSNASVNSFSTSVPTSGTTFTWLPNSSLTAPTSITSPSASVCSGESTVLTAEGGTEEASTLWFEGGCGNIVLSQQWQNQPYSITNATVNSIKKGILNITSSSDPNINIGAISSFTSSTFKYIAVRYKVVSGTNPGLMEIYYGTASSPGLLENKKAFKAINGDGSWHTMNIDMTTDIYGVGSPYAPTTAQKWAGNTITELRFDFTSNPGITMDIDYIVIASRPVLENTNANDKLITVTPTASTTDYYALRLAESSCLAITSCTLKTIYRGKTWNGGPTGDWSVASNWIPVGVPTADDCIEVGSSLTMAISGSHAVGKTLNVSTGNFTVNSGSSVTLKGALTVAPAATFTLDDTASLVQEGTTNTNSGNIFVKRTAKPMKRYDFTYWSSPVAAQTLYNLSPNTLGDKYYSWNPISQAWVIHYNGSDPMIDGKGYIVRAPQSFPIDVVNSTNFVGTFSGKPNSGDITTDVKGNLSTVAADFKWNLIGNPYPSAINLNKFLTDNASKINGTVYLWTHNSPPNNAIPGDAIYNYTASDYATYNGVGGTATSPATVDPLHSIVNPNPNINVPNGYLASGQSFFVRGKADATVKFTNDMRERVANNQFFRQSNTVENNIEKHRFWLNLRNNEGAFNQTLIGYIEGATNEFEDNFDGELFGGNYVTIYSINSNKELTIQGRALPFENSDVVPLGLKTTIAGTFSISLDNFEGLFLNQEIFLKDKLLNVIHDLKTGGYNFTTSIGTLEDRFEIIYQNEALGISNPEFNPNAIVIYKKDKTIVVNSGLLLMNTIQVFDIQGRLLYDAKNINSSETVIKNLPTTDQVLIVQVQTSEGNKVSKKIIY